MEKEVVVRKKEIEVNVPKRLVIAIGQIMGVVGGESMIGWRIILRLFRIMMWRMTGYRPRGGERAFILFYR